MDKYIGRLLDNRYEILDVIGTGGMVVYRARCHRLNRLVAIKILKEEYSQDEEFRRRFHAESQAVAMLNHPNIVSVYDVSTNGDADYIVMEMVDGITLKQYIERRGGYPTGRNLHFAMQIAKALEHAHNQGIVHRDIKPHNVMILKKRLGQGDGFRHCPDHVLPEHPHQGGAGFGSLYLPGAGQGRPGG